MTTSINIHGLKIEEIVEWNEKPTRYTIKMKDDVGCEIFLFVKNIQDLAFELLEAWKNRMLEK